MRNHRPKRRKQGKMIRIFYFIALLCTARSNPMGQTTVCESSPNLHPGLGYGASVYETPGVLPLPYGMGAGVGLGGVGYGLPYGGLASPLGATTVIETAPNMGVGYGMPTSGATTVCETSPNTPPGLLGVGYGLPYPPPLGGATVCEAAPNMLGWGYGLPYGLGMGGVWGGMGGLGLPVGYGAPLGVGNVYETSPNLLGLGYMPGYGLGATTPCESASNMLGLGMGLSLGRPFL